MMPKRIQMTRQRPWRKDHPDAVIVARGRNSIWGNPWVVGTHGSAQTCVDKFRHMLTSYIDNTGASNPPITNVMIAQDRMRANLSTLRGKDLACWCPLDQPCHADVLLDVANRPITTFAVEKDALK